MTKVERARRNKIMSVPKSRPLPYYCEGVCLKAIPKGEEVTFGHITLCRECKKLIDNDPELLEQLCI